VPNAPESEAAYACYHNRDIELAVRHFRQALAAGEDPNHAALERWLTMMSAGEFEEAWRESDRVLCHRQPCAHLPQHQQWVWDGQPLNGKSVLVHCYHGLGDTIQFIRLIPSLQQICSAVTVRPQPELLPLIPRAYTSSSVAPKAEIELMELPHILRLTPHTIPNQVPYLYAPKPHCASRKFRVGLTWASGVWRPERSIPLEFFSFLNQIPNLEVVPLQRGEATRNLPQNAPDFCHTDLSNTSIPRTARLIRTLDLVISTDTMVAHLAGALAAPVWTLLPFHADWRWLHNRTDSPWYPTMRLFRQVTPGDWPEVLGRVRRELTGLAALHLPRKTVSAPPQERDAPPPLL